MEKQILKKLVNENLSIREISEKTGKCGTSVRYWLKKYKLKTKIKKHNKGGLANKTKAWRKQGFCDICGEKDLSKFYTKPNRLTKTTRCRVCHNKKTIERFREQKKLAVEYKGGACKYCGYNKCLQALDFHHVNPSQKASNWKAMRNWVFERVKGELDKCELVCRNCHAEIHYGIFTW